MTVLDPYSSLVKLQLRGDGASGVIDTGPFRMPNRETTTRAAKSTSVKKYGDGAIFFDGNYVIGSTVDYVQYGDGASLAFGTNDFTIRFWIYPQSTSYTAPLVAANSTAWFNNTWQIVADHSSVPNKYTFWFYNFNSATPLLTSVSNVVYDAWVHIEITRSGSAFRMMVNGVTEATGTHSGPFGSSTSETIFIGYRCPMYLDDFQITNGIARHTGDFTPPDAELQIDPLASGSVSRVLKAASKTPDPATNRLVTSLRAQHQGGYGGVGRVTGTVKLKGSPTNTPLARQTYLLREPDMTLVGTTWSSAADGSYAFNNIDMSKKYTVLAYDYEHNYRAVIADNLTPERMP